VDIVVQIRCQGCWKGRRQISGANYLALLQNLPLVYILDQYQQEDPSCRSLIEGLRRGEAAASNFRVRRVLLCYEIQRGYDWEVCVPVFATDGEVFSRHAYFRDFWGFKTWRKVSHFYWPKSREISRYVRQCDLCRHAKPAKVGVPHGDPVVLSSWERFR
jgi:hypothetical protein